MSASDTTSDDPEVTDRLSSSFEPPDDTSDASPIFGAIGTLWFFAFGGGAAYFAIQNYSGPSSLTSLPVVGLMGAALVMFVASGVVAKIITWRSPTVPEDAPWTLRPAWQSSTLEEDLYFRSVPPWFAALFALPGLGAGGFIFYQSYWLAENPSSARLLFLIFPIAFSIPAVMTLRRVWHRRKYGTSTFAMEKLPGRLGQTLDGRVTAGVDPSAMQDDAFQVALTCYHRTKSGDDTSWRTLWEAKTEVQGQAASGTHTEPSANGGVDIPVSFDLPAHAPRSTPEKKSQRIAWILKVSAETSGLDYQSYFEIPVFEPDGPDEPGSEEAPSAAADSPAPESTDAPDRPTDALSATEESGAADESTVPEVPSSSDEPAAPREPAAPDSPSPDPSGPDPDAVPDDAASGAPSDRYEDDTEDRFSDDRGDDEDTVQCDNCYSTVDASASTCPACGADLEPGSGWFS